MGGPFQEALLLVCFSGRATCKPDDVFTTCSGRNVALRIWTPAQDIPKTVHAMYSLKAAMKWDEEVGLT